MFNVARRIARAYRIAFFPGFIRLNTKRACNFIRDQPLVIQ